MKPVSDAVLHSKKSSIRKLFELFLKSTDAISLGIGQPDFQTPENIMNGIRKALDNQKTMYPPALGIDELREAVGEKFRKENSMRWVQKENVMVTVGGSQAIALTFAALTNPGDEILINSPNFLSYYYIPAYYHTNLVEVARNPDYSINFEQLERKITPKTKLLIINSPNNPTGYVLTKNEVEKVVDLVIKHDLYLLSDEVYEKYLYNGRTHISPASLDGVEDRTITINSISKTFSATGLRVGYLAAPADIIPLMEKYAQYTAAGTAHPIQYGAVAGIKNGNPKMAEIIRKYDERRKYSFKRLEELNFDCPIPHGAFYIMPSVKNYAKTGDQFSEDLFNKQKVAVVGGSSFGSFSSDKVRISYATTKENLEKAFERIEKYLEDLK
ncbi:MAG: aminotransferase class I/II-fold pyridoxal phosphate-dependent enzyme [Candidatus Lokiarchaeota archaeon]|nr:aminotransferase class I/II-fold pyridoxal phosphate-dependent enzyme [Candidatus Lokiarchaeota archaeon]